MFYLSPHARIPTTVISFPQFNMSNTCYGNKNSLLFGISPIKWVSIQIQIAVRIRPKRNGIVLDFCKNTQEKIK